MSTLTAIRGATGEGASRRHLHLGHALWWLSVATTLGTAAELAVSRHWNDAIQLIPWAATVLLLATLWASRRGRIAHRTATLASGAVLASGAIGVFEHVRANWLAGPLDAAVGPTWDQHGVVAQLWLAATGGVGPSPPLAPMILTQAAILALLAAAALRGDHTTARTADGSGDRVADVTPSS